MKHKDQSSKDRRYGQRLGKMSMLEIRKDVIVSLSYLVYFLISLDPSLYKGIIDIVWWSSIGSIWSQDL